MVVVDCGWHGCDTVGRGGGSDKNSKMHCGGRVFVVRKEEEE